VNPAARLSELVETVPPRLHAIADYDAARKPGPLRWSKKEILGHRIDSASNNPQRFVRAQLEPLLGFPEYEQDGWVRVQRYQSRPWSDTIQLWFALNRHLSHVIEAMTEESLAHRCTIGHDDPVTLSWLTEHYVHHLEHHLDQIFAP
jgi:hypothetical protein